MNISCDVLETISFGPERQNRFAIRIICCCSVFSPIDGASWNYRECVFHGR